MAVTFKAPIDTVLICASLGALIFKAYIEKVVICANLLALTFIEGNSRMTRDAAALSALSFTCTDDQKSQKKASHLSDSSVSVSDSPCPRSKTVSNNQTGK